MTETAKQRSLWTEGIKHFSIALHHLNRNVNSQVRQKKINAPFVPCVGWGGVGGGLTIGSNTVYRLVAALS